MSPSTIQSIALNQELLNAVRLIRAGFGQIQNLDSGNDFYHLPILTLASGFERLMKVILCLRALEVHGEYSGGNSIPTGRDGHNLELLLQRVITDCFSEHYIENIPVAAEDMDYLESEELANFIRVLSQFGQSARYYYFDVLLGRKPKTQNPETEWQNLESEFLVERADLLALIGNPDSHGEINREISEILISKLERLARALARLFTIGRIGDEARRYVGNIGGFLHLSDSDLGKTVYDPCGRGF